ncbi:MAG: DUF2993 domain-containing protein [Thermacetogeniaceae bacterium]
MRRLLAGFLASVLVFLLLCEFTLPVLAERAIESEMARSSLKPEGVEARLFAFPAAKLLLGWFDGISLELRGAALGGCRAALVSIQIPRGSFDPGEIARGEGVALRTSGPMKVRIVFSERDLNDYIRTIDVPGISDPEMELVSRYVKLRGKVGILGSSFSFEMWGSFCIDDRGEIVFSPIDVRVGRESLPPELSRALASHIRFGLSSDKLPFAFRVKEVSAEPGCLVITGEGI